MTLPGNTGAMSLEEIEGNYASLAELANAHHIRVIFSSVLPIHNYTPQSTNLFVHTLARENSGPSIAGCAIIAWPMVVYIWIISVPWLIPLAY